MKVRAIVVAAVLAAAATMAHAASSAQITVYAAASLTNVLPRIDAGQMYSFGGSNTLAVQIQLGAPADVFASADMALPQQLYSEKLCSKPVVFARNSIAIVVPRSNPAEVRSIYDLRRKGVKLVIAGPGVPVGHYTLQLLKNMKLAARVLPNVVSREADVRGVLTKVALGEADAGFVYSTDAKLESARVNSLQVPARAQPNIQYGLCIVASSSHKADAQAFIRKVLGKTGQARLRTAGFLPRVKKKG
jgi:molybdate transport system substrate-binding protein